jgi:isoleucyl-tRNA synthetase
MEDMDLVVRVCSLGRSARNSAGLKLRQPLGKVGVVASESDLDRIKELMDIVVDELNVKEVSLTTDRTWFVDYVVNARPDLLGKKYGGMFPRIRDALDRLDAKEAASAIQQGRGVEVMVDGESFELLPEEVDVQTQPKEGYSLSEEEDLAVAIDTRLTPELRKEGLARDIVRRIQNQRKESGFDIDDRIETYYQAGSELAEVFKDFREYISIETLSDRIQKDEPPEGSHVSEYEIDGMSLEIGLRRV